MTLTKLALELEDARRDLERYNLLRTSEQRVEAAQNAYDAAKADNDKAMREQEAADYKAQFAGIGNIEITRTGATDEPLITAGFKIAYTKPYYGFPDYVTRSTRCEASGFGQLPDNVLRYIIEKVPGKIPAEIRALYPSDPEAAIGRYFQARKRGHL